MASQPRFGGGGRRRRRGRPAAAASTRRGGRRAWRRRRSPAGDACEGEGGGQAGLDEAEAAGSERDLGEDLRRAEGEQDEERRGVRSDGGERGEQGGVVERPARDGAGHGAAPARAEDLEQPVALVDQPVGKDRAAARRCAAAGCGSPGRSAPPRRAARRRRAGRCAAATRRTRTPRPIRVAVTRSRSTDPVRKAGIASTGRTRTTAKVRRLTAVIAAATRPLGRPLLDQHPVLEGAARPRRPRARSSTARCRRAASR